MKSGVAATSEHDGGYEFHGLPVEFAGISFGDLNGDDIVNYLDIIYLAQFIVHGYAANLPDRRAADLRTNGSTVVPTLLSSLITLARHSISGEEPLGPRPGSLTVLPVDGFGTPVYTAEIELIINGEPVGTFRTNTGVLSFNNVEEGDTIKLIVSRFDAELNETVTNTVTINSFDPYTNAAQVVVLGGIYDVFVGGRVGGMLTSGIQETAVFRLVTSMPTGSEITLQNINSVPGLSLPFPNLTAAGTLLILKTTETPRGMHPLTITINGVESNVFYLDVQAQQMQRNVQTAQDRVNLIHQTLNTVRGSFAADEDRWYRVTLHEGREILHVDGGLMVQVFDSNRLMIFECRGRFTGLDTMHYLDIPSTGVYFIRLYRNDTMPTNRSYAMTVGGPHWRVQTRTINTNTPITLSPAGGLIVSRRTVAINWTMLEEAPEDAVVFDMRVLGARTGPGVITSGERRTIGNERSNVTFSTTLGSWHFSSMLSANFMLQSVWYLTWEGRVSGGDITLSPSITVQYVFPVRPVEE